MKQKLLKTWLMLCLLLVGAGTTWGAIETGTYTLCTSTSDLVAGAHYIIASGTSGSVNCISNVENANNRKIVSATVTDSKIEVASNSTIMTLTLGGSTGAWTFHTDNYAGTNGYFASAASGSNNYCRVISTSTTSTISFSSNAAVITLQPHTSRNILRFNSSSSCFACYSTGQAAVYLYKKSTSGGGTTNYTVTVANDIANGTVTASPTSAAAGATVTLTATPSSGYEFGSWNVTNASTSTAISVTNNQFTMPAANVNVSATFNAIQGGGDEPSGDETEVTWIASEQGYTNGVQYTSATVDENISLAFGDGTNDGKYYDTGTGIRLYANGKLTVSASNGSTISKIVIKYPAQEYAGEFSASTGTYSLSTSTGTWTGTANSVVLTNKATSGHARIQKITVTYADDDGDDPDSELTLIGIEATGTPAEFWKGDAFNHDGITVTALWEDENETDVTSSCEFSGYDMSTSGQQTVTVTYQGETCQYGIEVKTIANTQAEAYTVAEAKSIIDAGKDLATQVYVKGTVSEIVTAWNDQYSNVTYNISADGETTSQQFQLFRCATNGAEVGDDVVAYGTLTKFNETYEFAAGNTIVKTEKLATLSIADITVANGDDITPVITTNIVGEYAVEYTSNNEEIVLADGDELVTMGVGSATITAYVVADGYKDAQTTFDVTVTTGGATLQSITLGGELTNTTYTIGDAFDRTGLTITANYSDNSHVDVTDQAEWAFDPETFTTAGTNINVDVYATYNGKETEIESYTVTVNKKTATITFAPATIDVEVGKNITLEPTTTPDDAEITYTITEGSENVSIEGAVVSGVAEGTATIRADYAGNGEYDAASTTVTINVIPAVTKVTFDLSIDETTTATESELSWVTTEVTMLAEKGEARTNTNNYYPGTAGQSYKSTRFYANSTLTITPATGITITKVEYTATTTGYATVLSSSTWNNASASANETLVTITPTDGTKAFSATLGNTTGATSVVVYYTGETAPALSSIALSGTYPTEFNKGDEFSHEGMTVTANYTDGNSADVTSSATFSGYDMNTLGEQTVTVSYTEGEITKTAQYNITINKVPFVPTIVAEGYEDVDFTTIEPYKSLGNNGSADMTTYEGTSFSAEFAKKAGTNNAPKFYQNGNAVRAYVDNTMTITGAENITNVDIAWVSGYVDNAVSITGLGTTTAVVTFSKTCRFTAITVGYKKFDLKVSDAGYATLCLPFNATVPASATVYTGKYNSNGTVTLSEVESHKIKAGEGYIVAHEGTHTFYITSDEVETPENNNLKGVTERTLLHKDDNIYILANQDDVVGFYKLGKDAYLGVNKAYLQVPADEVRAFVGFGDDTETGINSIDALPMRDGKFLKDGKIIIVKNGMKYNANGLRLR